MANKHETKPTALIAFMVLSIAVVGYFTGLQSPVRPTDDRSQAAPVTDLADTLSNEQTVLPATAYADMADATRARTSWTTQLDTLENNVDLLAEITIQPADKAAALRAREERRAFNGAPPTIPHPIDQLSDQACVACHTDGTRTLSLRIPRMSHQFLTNCTQCHVEQNPEHLAAALFRESEFAGLPAPTAGSRAFAGAPPVIPHSTWMRSNCMSCHGPTGLHGIRTTHPWRQNCQQCHAPSANLEQTQLGTEVDFLPPPLTDQSSAFRTNGPKK